MASRSFFGPFLVSSVLLPITLAAPIAACTAVDLGYDAKALANEGGIDPGGGSADGSSDAPLDGADAAVGVRSCVAASDCEMPAFPPAIAGCELNSGFSCVNGSCVYICGAATGMLCTVSSAPTCLTCPTTGVLPTPDPGPHCAASTCPSFPATMHVADSTCSSFPMKDDVVALSSIAACIFDATRSGGTDMLGRITLLESPSSDPLVADVPTQGGACVGTVWTSPPGKLVVNCPLCQFELTP